VDQNDLAFLDLCKYHLLNVSNKNQFLFCRQVLMWADDRAVWQIWVAPKAIKIVVESNLEKTLKSAKSSSSWDPLRTTSRWTTFYWKKLNLFCLITFITILLLLLWNERKLHLIDYGKNLMKSTLTYLNVA